LKIEISLPKNDLEVQDQILNFKIRSWTWNLCPSLLTEPIENFMFPFQHISILQIWIL